MPVKIPRSQKKWIGNLHYSLKYDGKPKQIINIKKERKQIERSHRISSEILFLDMVKLGLNRAAVIKLLGEPFFIYEDLFKGAKHTVFTYGLRSGSNKIKVEIHFIENTFMLGTLYYLADYQDYFQINNYIMDKYLISDFDLTRDCITDKKNNTLSLHMEQSYLIMNIYHLISNN